MSTTVLHENTANEQTHIADSLADDIELSGRAASNNQGLSTHSTGSSDGNPLNPHPSDIPDGGFKGWLTVAGCFLGLTSNFGLVNSVGAIESYVSNHQLENVSTSTVGWVFSIFLFMSSGLCLLAGEVFDRYGPRWPIMIGTLSITGGLVATGSCTQVWQFVLGFSLLTGGGCAMLMAPLVGIISHYFNRRRGLAMSLATVGGSVGGAVFPLLLQHLYTRVGFAWTLRIFALVCFSLALGAVVIVKPRITSPPSKSGVAAWISIAKNLVDFHSLVHDTQYRFLVFGIALTESAVLSIATLYSSYAMAMGFSTSTAILQLTIMSVVGIFSRFLTGYLSDIWGVFNVTVFMGIWFTFWTLAVWLPAGKYAPGLYIYSICFGATQSAVFAVFPVCIAKITRIENIGRRYSTCYLIVATVTLVTVPICGAIIGEGTKLRYDMFIVFLSVMGAVGSACLMTSRSYAVGWKIAMY